MDGNKRKFYKKHHKNQFKKKGSSKKGKWKSSSNKQPRQDSLPEGTVYRILCPSKKIGGVIGRGGGIIAALREHTKAKITVAEAVLGADERVILIYSSPEKLSRKKKEGDDLAEDSIEDTMEPHCAAQDALLKIHDRMVEEELLEEMDDSDDKEENVIKVRILVPNNTVGCLLGKGGEVIEKLRSETGASIRVLPVDHLPTCAMNTDELVQISGAQDVVKKALYEVSTRLHNNPPKNKSSSFRGHSGGRNFHRSAGPMSSMINENPMWPHRDSTWYGMAPMPWMGKFQNTGFGVGGFSGVPPIPGGECSGEFSMKVMCPAGRIGGVIGRGGSTVRQVEQETGTAIHVDDPSTDSDERIISISAFETLWNPRSQTISAILQLQSKTCEYMENATLVTTRLLVPSSKVGCILGQGGDIINEMRRRTMADIRVYSKDDKPKCAADNEELVQISGTPRVAADALAEIASRLRMRTLRDKNAADEPGVVAHPHRFGPPRCQMGGPPPPASMMSADYSRGFDPFRAGGAHEMELSNYPIPPSAIGFHEGNSNLDGNNANNVVKPVMESGGAGNFLGINEVPGATMHGPSEHLSAPPTGYHPPYFAAAAAAVPQNAGDPQLGYQNMPQQSPYPQHHPYQNMPQPAATYQNMNLPQQDPNLAPPQALAPATGMAMAAAAQPMVPAHAPAAAPAQPLAVTVAPPQGAYPGPGYGMPQDSYYEMVASQAAYHS